MSGDHRINQLGPNVLEPLKSTALVRPDQARIPRHIGGEDRGETAGLAHGASPAARRSPER
jgi:hypothetical protein